MEQRDYLKRKIDQLAQVFGKLLLTLIERKKKGQVREGIEVADQALKSELDLDIDRLLAIPSDQLVETLTKRETLPNQNIEKLADIMFELAEGFDLENEQEKATDLYKKTLLIYEHLDNTGWDYAFDRYFKIEKIKKRI